MDAAARHQPDDGPKFFTAPRAGKTPGAIRHDRITSPAKPTDNETMIPRNNDEYKPAPRQQGKAPLSGLDLTVLTVARTLRTFTLSEITSEVRYPSDEALYGWPVSSDDVRESLHRLRRNGHIDWTLDRRDGVYRTRVPAPVRSVMPTEAGELIEFIDRLASDQQMSPHEVGPSSAVARVLVQAGIMPGTEPPILHRRLIQVIAQAIGAPTGNRERGEFLFHRARVSVRRRLIELCKEGGR